MAGKTEDFRVPVAREGLKPSARQIYALAHMTVDMLGLTWPDDRRAASELIARLREHTAAQAVAEVAPF